MATQLLVNVLTVTNLGGGASVTLSHGLRSDDQPVTPTQVLCDRGSPLVVSAVNDLTITVTNPSPDTYSANFRCEYDHSIFAVGATPTAWQGAAWQTRPNGPAGGDLYGLFPIPRVGGFAGKPIDTTAPSAGQFWQFDGTVWRHVTVAPGVTPPAVYGEFSDNLDQPLTANVPYTARFSTTESASGVSVVLDTFGNPTRLTVTSAGVYEFSFSPQFLHTGGGTVTITFWAVTNTGVVPRSASSLEMGNNNNRTLPFISLILPMAAGDWLNWIVLTNGTNTSLEQFPAVVGPPAIPDIPSVIAGVKLIGV